MMSSPLRKWFCLTLLICLEGCASWVKGECRIESHSCDFPFTSEGKKFSSCTEHNATEGKYVCVSSHGEDRWSWGVCNSQCLEEEDGFPLDFGGETQALAKSCMNEPLPCVFPFVYNDVEYDKCTNTDADFLWCATHVDDAGVMIDNMWGKCDAESCEEESITEAPEVVEEEPQEEGPKNAKVSIDTDEITAELTFHQENPESELNIVGTITGLEPGLHGLAIHSNNGDNCSDVGPHFNPLDGAHGSHSSEVRHAGDLGNVEVGEDGVGEINLSLPIETTLFGDNSVLNKALVIYAEEDTLSADESVDMTPLACGVIYEEDEWPFILILIIALSVAIVLLLLLITILICCCMKRKKPKKKKALDKIPEDEILPLHNGNGSYNKKTPLYDELSIPFIDATPAPTPKLGRSIDRLSSFFTRNPSVGRSRGSLASIPPPSYPPPDVPANETPWKGSRKLRRK